MVSSYVVTQQDLAGKENPPDSVGLGSYGVDDFPFATVALDGKVALSGGELSNVYVGDGIGKVEGKGEYPDPDGLFLTPRAGIYKIPYRSITPSRDECVNLLVPVCCSASHIVMTSLRMEPVWMTLGESAGVAAAMAWQAKTPVQDVPYAHLRRKLLALGQVLDIPS